MAQFLHQSRTTMHYRRAPHKDNDPDWCNKSSDALRMCRNKENPLRQKLTLSRAIVSSRKIIIILLTIFLLTTLAPHLLAATTTSSKKVDNWLDIIRQSPYSITRDFYRNIKVIRRWVLLEQGFCEVQDRHIIYNRRGHFLGYISNLDNPKETQAKLNGQRERLASNGVTPFWSEGGPGKTGYPFALACNQPHVQMEQALKRMTGKNHEDRLWGSWVGLKVGSKTAPVSLTQAVIQVYHQRNISSYFEDHAILKDLLGQILIESGGRKHSHSSANATGLLQLIPSVISDCQIPKKFARHRLAQIDCALKLHRQNDRNLSPFFEQRFGKLPEAKKQKLYAMLLVQAYHGGVGRISELLKEGEAGKAGLHFAHHHSRFSAEEIALGLIFHNLGRNNLGLASLYYLVDVEIASEALCKRRELRGENFCQG